MTGVAEEGSLPIASICSRRVGTVGRMNMLAVVVDWSSSNVQERVGRARVEAERVGAAECHACR